MLSDLSTNGNGKTVTRSQTFSIISYVHIEFWAFRSDLTEKGHYYLSAGQSKSSEPDICTAVIPQEQGRFPGAVWCGRAIERLID
jgi:hypothetical protein